MIPNHIIIGDSSSHLNRYLSENNYSKICILVDENTQSNCLKKIDEDINFDYDIFKIDSGEEQKNLATCSRVWNFLTENLYDRKSLIINLGGGTQEILGNFLKTNINFKSKVICTGGAISYFTKDQAPINDMIDKLYLGWFYRLLFNPIVFIPRLLKSLSLFFKVLKDKVEII